MAFINKSTTGTRENLDITDNTIGLEKEVQDSTELIRIGSGKYKTLMEIGDEVNNFFRSQSNTGEAKNIASIISEEVELNSLNNVSSSLEKLEVLADVQVIMGVSPKKATIGDRLNYTVLVSNIGPSDALNVNLENNIPDELINSEFSLDGGKIWNSWTSLYSMGTLKKGEMITILIRGTITDSALDSISNTIRISSTTLDLDLTNNISTTNVEVLYANLIGENFVKKVDKNFANIKEILTYTISVINKGNVCANNIYLTDLIPSGTSYINKSLRVNGVVNLSDPKKGIALTNPIGVNKTVIIVYKVLLEEIPVANQILNKAFIEYTYTVNSIIHNRVINSGEVNKLLTEVNTSELILINSSDKLYKDLGDIVIYTIEIFNQGNISANNINFIDDLSDELEFIVDSVFIDNINFVGYDPKVGFSVANIEPLDTIIIRFEANVIQVPKNGSVENIATVNYTHIINPDLPEMSYTKISDVDKILIAHGEILKSGVVKAANQEKVGEADIINYTVDITNSGNVAINNVVLKEILPNEANFMMGTVTINGIVAALENPDLDINLGVIEAHETICVGFDVKVQENPSIEFVNKATVDYSYLVDPEESPREKMQKSNEVIVGIVIPKVSLEKLSNFLIATVGDIIIYTLIVANTGDIDVFDVIINDLLESNIEFIEDSVKVNGSLVANASILSGINIGTLMIGEVKVITFEAKIVNKIDDFIGNIAIGTYKFITGQDKREKINDIQSNFNEIKIEEYELTIEKDADKIIANLNDIITYTVKLYNSEEVNLMNVIFKDELPNNLEFVENSFKIDEVVVNCKSLKKGINIGILNSKEGVSITYKTKVIGGTPTGYSINSAYAEFNYKLSNDVTGMAKTEVVDTCVEIRIASFKQLSINKEFKIPILNLDIEEIDEVMVEIEITDSYSVKVKESISNERQILSEYKLIVHGYINILTKYTALVEDQAVHLAESKFPFSTFIILPNSYIEGQCIEIREIVEDIEYDLICKRCISVGLMFLLVAVIKC